MNKLFLLLIICSIHIFSQNQFQSFLDRINSLPDSARPAVADSFFNYARIKGIPFIENTVVNFIYKGNASSVQLAGDLNGWNFSNSSFTKISGTNFFYRTLVLPINARSDYKFVLNGNNWIIDPQNPIQNNTAFGPNSELAMPGFVQPWEIKYQANIKHGIFKRKYIQSINTQLSYQLDIYLPPDFDSTKNYPVVYIQDGTDYITYCFAQNIIENLLDSGKIKPFIGVFVKPNDRMVEYGTTKRNQYVDFFAKELVPFIDSFYNTIKSPDSRLVLGTSLGGNISTLISFKYPEIFGLLGEHSSAVYFNTYEASNIMFNGEKKPIKIFSVWGSWETPVTENWRAGKEGLIAKGYDFKWAEYPDGHSWGLWRHTFDDMLIFFFPANTSSIKDDIYANNFTVHQNYPNPFNPTTTISFTLSNTSYINIKVFDLLGNEIADLGTDIYSNGVHNIKYTADNNVSGVYFYRINMKDMNGNIKMETKKMILMK